MSRPEILLVEDDRRLSTLYGRWLADSYDVYQATDDESPLDLLTDSLEVVLVNCRSSRLSVDELLPAIHTRGLDCRIVVLTAVEPGVDLTTLGVDGYLVKPLTKASLEATVESLLGREEGEPRPDPPLEDVLEAVRSGGTDLEQVRERAFRRLDVDMDRVAEHDLPPIVSEMADEYERKIGHRNRFLLQWLHVVFPLFTLSSVDGAYETRARTDKALASMFVMLLDDIGEYKNDTTTLSEVAKLPASQDALDREVPGLDLEYAEVTETVWRTLHSRIRDAPRYDEIASLLQYDLQQVIHAIQYSVTVNDHPEIANTAEAQALGAHNMMMLTYADIDIAYSPAFDMDELGALRSLILEVQEMARIGNWVTTWERELEEGDVSAGVFVSAVENGVVSPAALRNAAVDPTTRDGLEEAIRTAHVEDALLEQWQQRFERLRVSPPRIESIDVDGLLEGIERVMAYHLASRGLK